MRSVWGRTAWKLAVSVLLLVVLVVRYGGHVTVQSVVGEGSTFTVTLPLSEQ